MKLFNMSYNDEPSGCTTWLIIVMVTGILGGLAKGCVNVIFDKDFSNGQSSEFGIGIFILIVIIVISIVKKISK